MQSAGKMRISVHCTAKNMPEVSLRTRQGEDVFQLVRGIPCLQDYLQGSGDVEAPPAPDVERHPPLEVSNLVECKVASWLRTVDSFVGSGEVEVSDAEERKECLPVEEVELFSCFSF